MAAESKKSMVKPPVAVQGGLDNHPYVTGITPAPEGGSATVEWYGVSGPYELEAKSSLADDAWLSVGSSTTPSALLPTDAASGFLRIKSPDANYVGAQQCALCHVTTHAKWSETAHARAFDTLKQIGQHENSQCLPCHTVGYGQPNGFNNEADDSALEGVQCENCHGPGGNHAGNPFDPSTLPIVTIDAAVCGGCHTDVHHPTYNEWKESLHSRVDSHVSDGFITDGESREISCGGCHSGAVRLAMIAQISDIDGLFPSREDAAFFGQTCATCHNPHDNTLNSQLRNPSYSTEFFSYVTSLNLKDQYNPNIQICGQCHNERGATWNSSSRPPHHSPQYNMLVGKIATPGTANDIWNGTMSFHGEQPLQCVQCHTHAHPVDNPDEENPNYTGHGFDPQVHGCTATGCHTSESVAQVLWTGAQIETKASIQKVKGLLDDWAMTKASEALREKYGTLAWEFSSPGQISNPDGTAGITGPTTAEQSGIPDEVKKARFLLYIVEHDGSFGIHNGDYSRFLLSEAEKLALAAP